jgi:hypothetical protein
MSITTFLKVMGAVFIIVAIWGFIDGQQVLVFHVNTLHNIVHLVSGLGALGAAFAGPRPARLFALIFGAVYGLVALLGFAGVQPVVDMLHLNPADNWLHLFLAVAFVGAGVALPDREGEPLRLGAGSRSTGGGSTGGTRHA